MCVGVLMDCEIDSLDFSRGVAMEILTILRYIPIMA